MPALHSDSGWTADMVRALPDDGNRYEVVDGALLVSPSPQRVHQRAVAGLYRRLHEFTQTHAIGETLFSPADIEFSPRRMVQPDLFVLPLVDGHASREWSDVHTLLLAVEVLSPSTARADRVIKRRMFQEQGVPEYWVVDLDARLVERWRPTDERGEICADRIEWRVESHAPGLIVELREFFAEVLDP